MTYLKRIRALRVGKSFDYKRTIDELLKQSREGRWLKGDWVDNVQSYLGEAVVEEQRSPYLRTWSADALLAVFDVVLPLPPDKDGVSYAGPRRKTKTYLERRAAHERAKCVSGGSC